MALAEPKVLGYDGAGVVEEAGPAAVFAPGDRVMYMGNILSAPPCVAGCTSRRKCGEPRESRPDCLDYCSERRIHSGSPIP